MEKILSTIKKMLVGIADEYDAFDQDILIYINMAFSTLTQLGVGPTGGFICNPNSKWSDYLSDYSYLEDVKTYIYIKVKLVFDPPSSSFVLSSLERMKDELEWRMNVTVDPGWEELNE